MDDDLRKVTIRNDLKHRFKNQKIIPSRYHPKYPDSAEREYIRLVNEYMLVEKEILIKYLLQLRQVLNEGTRFHADSKKDNERKRKTARFSAIDNTIIRLEILFKSIQKELNTALGLYGLKRRLNRIAALDHKLTVAEWKKVVSKTFGINLLEDYYDGEFYQKMLVQWVSANVDLISTIPKQSLNKMKEVVYQNYMSGCATTDIVKEIQRLYGTDKRHARLIARDQTAKLNAAITKHQQRDAGVMRYQWSSSRDRRVRPSHRKLDGKIFSWDSPPETDGGRRCHPGEDFQCRCCALPIFDLDTLELPV